MDCRAPGSRPHCSSNVCRRGKCALALEKRAAQVLHVLDCDTCRCLSLSGKRCDFVVLCQADADTNIVAIPVEMKVGKIDLKEVIAQLTAGAKLCERILTGKPNVELIPLLLFAKPRGSMAVKATIRNSRSVTFRRRACRLRIYRCGSNLREILSSELSRTA